MKLMKQLLSKQGEQQIKMENQQHTLLLAFLVPDFRDDITGLVFLK